MALPSPFAAAVRNLPRKYRRAYRRRLRTVNSGFHAADRPQARPPVPPAGMYDPALEAQRRAAQRGLLDLSQDTELGNARAGQDYTFGVQGLQQQRQRGFEDIARQVQTLTRDYGSLARRQAEGDAQAGVINPAIAARQMQIRAANMAFDRQPLDQARGRIAQDYSTNIGRLGVDFTRGGVDRATALARGRRENTQFGLDIGAQERYQAVGAGWEPPKTTAPKMFLWPDGKWRKRPWHPPPSPVAHIANPYVNPLTRPLSRPPFVSRPWSGTVV